MTEPKRSKWNSRKLGVALLAFTVATFLVWFEKIDASAWSTAMAATVGAYLLSQAYVDKGNGA